MTNKTHRTEMSRSRTNPTAKTGRGERKPAGDKTQRQRVEEEIANRVIELLDQGQLPPWEKGWNDSRNGVPCNTVGMKPYRGINRWMTLITQQAMGYDDPAGSPTAKPKASAATSARASIPPPSSSGNGCRPGRPPGRWRDRTA